ncbi:putative RNase H-like nuclease (RuvC/YqgF family) [Naumannella cuiyingiana]|uniref:Putative RNase H-like nuclease (RuvC/YqgF family) n=1 Tax=Naumannella cuiyingiana TaxID=1347891 RepID=A0A7Z0D9I3_9ACTN|nr:hypothetical protein [Naumannella cuiyingiana]NYI71453.1 putative RNase H-like nuclease (RuvC/YqgF family) [Naumannella cuiyingiana]
MNPHESTTATAATPDGEQVGSVKQIERALMVNCSLLSRRLSEAQSSRIELLSLIAKQHDDISRLSKRLKALERQVARSTPLEKSKLGRLQRRVWRLRTSLRRGGKA